MADDVGDVEVDVVADFSAFERRLRTMLSKMAAKAKVNVRVETDTSRATVLLEKWRKLQLRVSRRHGFRMGRSLMGAFLTTLRSGLEVVAKTVGETLSSLVDIAKRVGQGIGKAFTSTGNILKKVGPLKLLIVALIGLIPLLTSAIGALVGSMLAFVAASAQAVTVSFAYVGILGSIKQAMVVGKIAAEGFADAVGGDEKAMKKLAPAAQESAKALKALTPQWTALKKAVQGRVFEGLAPMFTELGKTTLPVLRTGLERTAEIMNNLAQSFLGWTTSEGFVRKFGKALSGNNEIFQQLKRAAVPLLRGMLNLYIALQPAALKLATKIKEVAFSFRQWSNGEGLGDRLTKMFDRGWRAATRLWKIIKNLGGALGNVFGAAVGPGNGLLKTLVKLTKRFEVFTSKKSTKNAITEFVRSSLKAMGRLIDVFATVGKQLARLFNPDILNAFFAFIDKISPTMSKIFDAIVPVVSSIFDAVEAYIVPVFDKISEALEKNGPKFEAFFAALKPFIDAFKPLLAGFGAVIGEIIGQTIDIIGSIAGVVGKALGFITPFVTKVSEFVGPILTKFAPIIATIILAFTTWGSSLVKLVPIIGRLLSPLVKFVEYIFKTAAPVFKVIGKVVGVVFKGIWKVISTVFGVVKTIVVGAMKIIGKVITGGFNVIKAVVFRVLPGIKNIVTTVFRAIGSVIRTIMSVIRTIISTAWSIIKTIFTKAIEAIKWVVDKTFGAISRTIVAAIDQIVEFVKGIPEKIRNLASRFLEAGKSIGGKVMDGIRNGLSAAGGFISDLGAKIKNLINDTLHLPITLGKGPLKFTIPAFANGTNYAPGGMALVGERGPELVRMPKGSQVKTAEQTRNILGRSAPSFTIINPIPERASESVQKVLTRKTFEAGWAS